MADVAMPIKPHGDAKYRHLAQTSVTVLPRWLLYALPWTIATWTRVFPVGRISNQAGMRLADVLIALIAISILVITLVSGLRVRRQHISFSLALLCLVTAQLILTLTGTFITFGIAPLLFDALVFLKGWGLYALIPIATAAVLKPKNLQWMTWHILGSSILLAMVTIHQSLLYRAGFVTDIGNPNRYGFALLVFVCLSLELIRSTSALSREITEWKRKLVYAILGLQLAACLATGSRATFIGLLVLVALWLFRMRRHLALRRTVQVVIVTIGMTAVLFVSPLAHALVQRLQVPWDMNFQARLLGISVGLRLVAEHPFGVGASWRIDPSRFSALDVAIKLAPDFVIIGSHNQYMNIAAESGIAGLFLFLLTLFLWLKRTNTNTAYGSALRLATSVLMVVGILDSPLTLAQVSATLWFLLAVSEVERSCSR